MAARRTKKLNSDASVSLVLLLWLLAFFGSASLFTGSRLLAQDRRNMPSNEEMLLLVRSWDPKSYELIGWLPTHRAAMTLRYLSGEQPQFDLNDAVSMSLPHPDAGEPRAMRIAPGEELSYQGQRWLPVERERNLVRIGKSRFYVVSIDFGDSKWRRATIKE